MKIQIKEPLKCTEAELNEFEQLVTYGAQVNSKGLLSRIKHCKLLAFCYTQDEVLVGISAIKYKPKEAVEKVHAKAKIVTNKVPTMELGYSVTKKEYRGQGINRKLNDLLLERIGNEDIFATTDNDVMRKYLLSCGFVKMGSSYKGNYNEQLDYFERSKA